LVVVWVGVIKVGFRQLIMFLWTQMIWWGLNAVILFVSLSLFTADQKEKKNYMGIIFGIIHSWTNETKMTLKLFYSEYI